MVFKDSSQKPNTSTLAAAFLVLSALTACESQVEPTTPPDAAALAQAFVGADCSHLATCGDRAGICQNDASMDLTCTVRVDPVDYDVCHDGRAELAQQLFACAQPSAEQATRVQECVEILQGYQCLTAEMVLASVSAGDLGTQQPAECDVLEELDDACRAMDPCFGVDTLSGTISGEQTFCLIDGWFCDDYRPECWTASGD